MPAKPISFYLVETILSLTDWWRWDTSLVDWGWDQVGAFGPIGTPNNGLPVLFAQTDTQTPVRLPVDWEKYISNSLQSMLPGVRPGMSLLNNILELRDFKSLPKSLSKIENSMSELSSSVKNWKKLVKSGKSLCQILKSTSKTASDALLQSQFNIMPLLNDLDKTIGQFKGLDRQINNLLAGEGKPRNAYYMFPLTSIHEPNDEFHGPNQVQYLCGYEKARRITSFMGVPMFRAQMQYSYTLTDYQRANARVLSVMDTLGLGFNPSILWNAIRWSFVVDWVLGVSQWLKRNADSPNMKPRTVIHRYSSSFKVVRALTLSHTLTLNCPVAATTWIPLGSCIESVYYRSPSMPDIYSSLQVSGINPKEFILGTALVITR